MISFMCNKPKVWENRKQKKVDKNWNILMIFYYTHRMHFCKYNFSSFSRPPDRLLFSGANAKLIGSAVSADCFCGLFLQDISVDYFCGLFLMPVSGPFTGER